jgi:hypothetical protein
VSVLLPTDDVALFAAGVPDAHGWVGAGDDNAAAPMWSGRGALQLSAGITAPGASQGGGAGPFAPAMTPLGSVFLPPDAPVADGMVLTARGRRYVLSSTHLVVDPIGAGNDCMVASVSELEVEEGLVAP